MYRAYKPLKALFAAVVALAMCVAMGFAAPGAHAAASDAANVKQALEYMKQLNDLRATTRTALSAGQIAAANGKEESQIASDTADGKPVSALNVNWDVMEWAQKRADELAAQGGINHDNMANGRPSWCGEDNLAGSSVYQSGTLLFGPEALAMGYPDIEDDHNPIDLWASELESGDQGYGHYLTEVSKLADVAGIGVAKVSSGSWAGATITVLEIAYVGDNTDRGTSESVEDALKRYSASTTYTVSFDSRGGSAVAAQSVKEGAKASKPANPSRSGYSFRAWTTDAAGKQTYDFNSAVTSNVTLYAQWTANNDGDNTDNAGDNDGTTGDNTDNNGDNADNAGNSTDNDGGNTDATGDNTDGNGNTNNAGDNTDNAGNNTDNAGDNDGATGDNTNNAGDNADNGGGNTDNDVDADNAGSNTDNAGDNTDNAGDNTDTTGDSTDNAGNSTDATGGDTDGNGNAGNAGNSTGATFDSNGGALPEGRTGTDGKVPVPTRDGYKFDGWYDDEGNLITNLKDAAGKTLHARWTKLNTLASTGATALVAGLTALALAAAGVTVGVLRRRRSR
ncbi:InlB B-repeat-containing protein [Bifidobacterium panos]|uniref:Flg new, Listeria-Bacteroides repeat domain n=1 Tax=Bifidobacterium panos TaxID=2675321 RepID=A0ABX1SXB7_9BIFI|nr:InlB B-repeat-containing protein [Bifidobacterium sp. DSM 109963]NMN02491.1 Flg new, Listeria-Bacteroides repeat domain [Bifidobacterium sp. DSM 109963]